MTDQSIPGTCNIGPEELASAGGTRPFASGIPRFADADGG